MTGFGGYDYEGKCSQCLYATKRRLNGFFRTFPNKKGVLFPTLLVNVRILDFVVCTVGVLHMFCARQGEGVWVDPRCMVAWKR